VLRRKAREGSREKAESDRCAGAHVGFSLKHRRGWWKSEEEEDDEDEDDEEDDQPASLCWLYGPTLALHSSCTRVESIWWGGDCTGVGSAFRR